MKYRFGISVFTGLSDYNLEDSIAYLKEAANLGFKTVFTSAHINEAKKASEELQTLIEVAYSLNMQVSIDVSKPMMANFTVPNHTYALRLDYGFSDDEIIDLSNNVPYMIELNASTINPKRLDKLVEKGLNIKKVRASFNYYPKLYTGHDLLDCLLMINKCHEYGITVLAFIPSHVGKRPPLYEGLPTIESHRYLDTDLAIEELKAMELDEIAFGDAYCSHEELFMIKKHLNDDLLINFNYNLVKEEFLEHVEYTWTARPDANSYLIRMTSIRGKKEIEPFNTIERKTGAITIDNSLFGRYKGEINICLKDLPADGRVNVIGYIYTTPFILEKVRQGRSFTLIRKE